MDFHSLSRKELQTLCKKNQIPANMTNIAMADALKAQRKIEEIEDLCPEKDIQQTLPNLDRSCRKIGSRTSARKRIGEEQLKEPESLDDQVGILPESSPTFTRTRRVTAGRSVSSKNLVFPAEKGGSEIPMTPLDLTFRRSDGTKKAEKSEFKEKEEKRGAATRSRRRRSPHGVTTVHTTRRSSRLKVPDNLYKATVSKELFDSESVGEPNNRNADLEESSEAPPVLEKSNEILGALESSPQLGTNTCDSGDKIADEGDQQGFQISSSCNLTKEEEFNAVNPDEVLDQSLQKSSEINGDVMEVIENSQLSEIWNAESEKKNADVEQEQGSQILACDEVSGEIHRESSQGFIENSQLGPCKAESEEHGNDPEQEQSSIILDSGSSIEEGNYKALLSDKFSLESSQIVETFSHLGSVNFTNSELDLRSGISDEFSEIIHGISQLDIGNFDLKSSVNDEAFSQASEACNSEHEINMENLNHDLGSDLGSPIAFSDFQRVDSSKLDRFQELDIITTVVELPSEISEEVHVDIGNEDIKSPNQELGSDLATSTVQGVDSSKLNEFEEPHSTTIVEIGGLDESSPLSDYHNSESEISVEVKASYKSLPLLDSGMPEKEPNSPNLCPITATDLIYPSVVSGESSEVEELHVPIAELSFQVPAEPQLTSQSSQPSDSPGLVSNFNVSDSDNADSLDHGVMATNALHVSMFSDEVSGDDIPNSQKSMCSSDLDLKKKEMDTMNNKENTEQEVDLKKISLKELQKLLNKGEIDLNQLSMRKLKRLLKENPAKRAPLQRFTENGLLGCETSEIPK